MANARMATPGRQTSSAPAPPEWAWWRRRGVVVALGLGLWFGLVLYYLWPAWAMVVYRLIFDGGVLLLWLGSAAGWGSVLLPLLRAMDSQVDRGALRFVTAAALGLGLMSLIVLALGLVGWLSHGTAIGLVSAGVLAGSARLVRMGWQSHPHSQWLADRAGWAWLLLLGVPFIAVMTAGSMLPPGYLWTPNEPHGYDVVEYHLQVPREWYEAGRIVPLHHNVFSFFPFNVEMHYLLAMHLRGGPWAGMYLAQLMHGAMILLAVLGVCGFARRLALGGFGASQAMNRRASSVLAALAMLTTPWLAQLGAIAYDEGGFLLFGALAVGWTARAIRESDRRFARFVLAGIMAGFACGSKLTAVPEVLLAAPLIALGVLALNRRKSGESPGRLVSGPVVCGAVGLMCFAPWLIRTAAWSGNPVFPELPSVLGHGQFSPIQVERWRHAHARPERQNSIGARLYALGTELLWSWQFGYVLFPLAIVGAVMNGRDPAVQFLAGLLVVLILFWLGFTHLQSRFLILAAPICALLIARLPWFVGVATGVQGLVGFAILNGQFFQALHKVPDPDAFIAIVGLENFSPLIPPAAQEVPESATLTLVGEGRAFLYQRPMSRLRYRTVFDADTSAGRRILDAWAGPPSKDKSEWLLIDPDELRRFESYQPFPSLPPEIAAHAEPYLQRR